MPEMASDVIVVRPVLAASVFHYGKFTIGQVKAYMAEHNVPVRL